MIDLKIAVDVGFVEGTIPIINPTGSAISITFVVASSCMMPTVLIFLIALYKRVEAIWFL